MIGSSPKMIEIYKTVSLVAPTNATVLMEGETGTGKEMIARMVHSNSPRANQPFVPVDCGSIAPSLLESELFGALKGAYTGADRDRMGVFEAANNGTVFLDEIGDLELGFQLNLLRFLQEKEIRPLGSPRGKKVDVRVVAATNRDLQKMVEQGKFREDLWYRLNVVRVILPPLVERRGDVPLLAHYFLKKYNERYHQQARLTESALRVLEDYSWPGNVRQLAAHDRAADHCDSAGPHRRRRGSRSHRTHRTARHCERDTGRYRSRPDPARAGGHGRKQEPRGQDSGDRAQDTLPQTGTDGFVTFRHRYAKPHSNTATNTLSFPRIGHIITVARIYRTHVNRPDSRKNRTPREVVYV